MQVRPAAPRDLSAIVDLSRRVQDRLTESGSLQEFGPIPADVAAAHLSARTAFVLERAAGLLGGVFIEPARAPVTSSLPATLGGWGLDPASPSLWFLQKLMVEPREQGGGIGRILLDGAIDQAVARGAKQIALDCWAGNAKLRDFYTRAGFRLYGVFPEGDYEVAVFLHAAGGQIGSS